MLWRNVHSCSPHCLFRTWLTCNLNSPNSADNRLLCRGSVCVRGQGGDRLPLCASPMKFSSGANQGGGVGGGGESVHRFKSAPARAAEFISNLLTLLALQIETSSGARRGAACERQRDDLRTAALGSDRKCAHLEIDCLRGSPQSGRKPAGP